MNAEDVLALDDHAFAVAWPRLPLEERRGMPEDVQRQCIERFRLLTPYVDASISRADRQDRAAARDGVIVDFKRAKLTSEEKMPADDWPVPLDVFAGIAAPPFSPADVPRLVFAYAGPFARAAGFDFSGVAVACVVAAAAMLSDEVRVLLSRRSSWYEVARLWTLLVGSPGTGKTPAIRAALRPTVKLHRQLVEEWERDNPDPEKAPPRPALFTSDATVEKLAEILRDNPRGVLYTVDEFESWIGSLDAYRQGLGSRDRGEWLRLYDGGPHQVDRIKRGSFFVANWGASLLSATTWATLEKHARHLPADGLLQRFLPVLLRPRPEPDPLVLTAEVTRAEEALEARMLELYRCGPGTVALSADAGEVFDEESRSNRTLVDALEPAGEPLAAHVGKHSALLGRVALAFHAIEHGADLGAAEISLETMRTAQRFMRRAFAHTVALHQRLGGKSSAWPLARDLARSILADSIATLNARTAIHGCRAFRSAEDWQRRQAVETLVACGWLAPADPHQRYGDHGAAWAVNPYAPERFARIGEEHAARRRVVAEKLRTATQEDAG